EADLHVVLNMSDQQISIELPGIGNRAWCLALDTSLQSPHDIVGLQDQKPIRQNYYTVSSRAVVVFENGYIE
ncbi:MAG: hypothetical protein ISR72_06790, partial [Methylobacter sp.]|nr:hypothetical protein [Methylobacter sp.]